MKQYSPQPRFQFLLNFTLQIFQVFKILEKSQTEFILNILDFHLKLIFLSHIMCDHLLVLSKIIQTHFISDFSLY